MARALVRLSEDPEERRQLSRAGLAQAGTWPDEDQVADDVLAAYALVADPPGSAPMVG